MNGFCHRYTLSFQFTCRVLFTFININDLEFVEVMNYVVKYGGNVLEPLKFNLVKTTFDIIQMVIDEAIEINADDYQKFLVSWIQAATMFGIAWGIGGILNDESRKSFDQFHRKVCMLPIYDRCFKKARSF